MVGCAELQPSPLEVASLQSASAVEVKIVEIEGKVDDFHESGHVDNEGVSRGLKRLLSNAGEAAVRGDSKATVNMMGAFQNRVRAQKGKHIDSDAADELDADAQAAIELANGTADPRQADLAIVLSVTPDPVDAGQELSHAITIRNAGPDAVTSVAVNLHVAGDVEPGATSECAEDAASGDLSFDCTIATLAAGSEVQFTIVVVPQSGGETLTSMADIVGWQGADDPDPSNNSAEVTTEVIEPGLAAISTDGHTCALTSGGDAYCWGANRWGQLGDGGYDTRASEPVVVRGELTFAVISVGGEYTCGITTAAEAFCWGNGSYGVLGTGSLTAQHEPAAVSGELSFAAISASSRHTCAVTTSGDAYCWGSNDWGELGIGEISTSSLVPVLVLGGHRWASISTGSDHTCGVTTDGDGYCWGSTKDGALGSYYDSSAPPTVPTAVMGGFTFAAIEAGSSHSCGITTAGEAYCWGSNWSGRLGAGTSVFSSTVPVAVSGGHIFRSISVGSGHACGVTDLEAAYCWGHNFWGQLGDGTDDTSSVPTEVAGGHAFRLVSAGNSTTCGLTVDGKGYCWGNDTHGRLGVGPTGGDVHEPTWLLLNDL